MKRVLNASATRLLNQPERLLRALFGPPPRNDRGIEQDLHTHALLRLMELAGLGELHEQSVAKARRHYERHGGLVDLPAPRRVEQRSLEIPGPAGSLRARLYLPPQRARNSLMLWLHGGGYVIGNLNTHAAACATVAERSGCTILAVDYRKSPEHVFPAASDDGLASFRWLRKNAADFDCDPDHVVIGGDSAGANLCAGVCHRLRDAGEAQPRLQVLVYPMTNVRASFPSRRHFAEGAMLTAELMEWFRGHYLPDLDARSDPLISPLLADRFDALAPALIHTAGFDPLRDEGEAYAQALRDATVEVDYRCHERLIHGYLTMGGASPGNRAAILALGDDLRRHLY